MQIPRLHRRLIVLLGGFLIFVGLSGLGDGSDTVISTPEPVVATFKTDPQGTIDPDAKEQKEAITALTEPEDIWTTLSFNCSNCNNMLIVRGGQINCSNCLNPIEVSGTAAQLVRVTAETGGALSAGGASLTAADRDRMGPAEPAAPAEEV